MNREEVKNDINKLIDEIVDMLDSETALIEFKSTLIQVLAGLKYSKEIVERLKKII